MHIATCTRGIRVSYKNIADILTGTLKVKKTQVFYPEHTLETGLKTKFAIQAGLQKAAFCPVGSTLCGHTPGRASFYRFKAAASTFLPCPLMRVAAQAWKKRQTLPLV